MSTNTTKKSIACHDGQFHADEITAIALMRIFMDLESVDIIRTRDVDTLDLCDYQVDVGGLCAPEEGYFDHHQFDKDHEYYGNSSAGLVWGHIKSTIDLAIPYTSLDYLIQDVDDQDTGKKYQGPYHFCGIVSSFNQEDVYSPEQNDAFAKALEFVEDYIHRIMDKAHTSYMQHQLAHTIPVQSIADIDIAIVPSDAPYIAKHHFIDIADVLVTWDKNQSAWTVLMVPISNDSFESKYTLAPANDRDEVFTHKAGFIGKYYEKKDGTIYFIINKDGEEIALSLGV